MARISSSVESGSRTATLRVASQMSKVFELVNRMADLFGSSQLIASQESSIIPYTIAIAGPFRTDRSIVITQLYHKLCRFLCLLMISRRTILAELLILVRRTNCFILFCTLCLDLLWGAGIGINH